MEVVDILKKYSKSIDEEIQNSLGTVDPKELQKSTQHLIKAGGKSCSNWARIGHWLVRRISPP